MVLSRLHKYFRDCVLEGADVFKAPSKPALPKSPTYSSPNYPQIYMRNKDFLRFDIPVYYALFVELCYRSGDLVQYFAYSVDFVDLGGEILVDLG